ncbi:MAG: tetratricopeptide repeat protein [Gammaproteobacteria bacterium]
MTTEPSQVNKQTTPRKRKAPASKEEIEKGEKLQEAKQGDAIAQIEVGRCYEYGICGFGSDAKEAFHYYQLAAQADVSYAHYKVARCYHYGVGVPKDLEKAKESYHKAVDHDLALPAAMYELAKCYISGSIPDKRKCFEWLTKSVEHPWERAPSDAYFMLGRCYDKGIAGFIERDHKKAAKFFSAAIIDDRHVPAEIHLYALFAKNEGGGTLEKAIEGLHYSLDLETSTGKYYAELAYHLGNCYFDKAKKNYKLVSEYIKAHQYTSYVSVLKQAQADETKWLKYLTIATNKNFPKAVYAFGESYQEGYLNLPKNFEKAKECFLHCVMLFEKNPKHADCRELLPVVKAALEKVKQLITEQNQPTSSTSTALLGESLTKTLQKGFPNPWKGLDATASIQADSKKNEKPSLSLGL